MLVSFCFYFALVSFLNCKKEISRKWIIFTRTAPELHQLDKISLQSKLIAPLLENITLDNIEKATKATISTWSLAHVVSSDDCKKKIDDFYTSHATKVLLIVADMNLVSASQLNFARDCIFEGIILVFYF